MKSERPFIHSWRWALAHADIPYRHEALLMKLSVFAKSEGDNAYPPQKRLAKMMGASERTIERLIADLKQTGWLHVTKKANSSGRANVYQLRIGHRFDIEKRALRLLDPLEWDDKLPENVESLATRRQKVSPARQPVRQPAVGSEDALGYDPDEEF